MRGGGVERDRIIKHTYNTEDFSYPTTWRIRMFGDI